MRQTSMPSAIGEHLDQHPAQVLEVIEEGRPDPSSSSSLSSSSSSSFVVVVVVLPE
jgi:hypothetical protein